MLGLAIVAGLSPSPSLAGEEVGATIESRIYVSEDASMQVLNRSTTAARFVLEPEGGWTVEPAELVLEPGELAEVVIGGQGSDGAAIAVRVTSVAEPDAGTLRGEALLVAHVYYERPFDPLPAIALSVFGLVCIVMAGMLYVGRPRRRRRAA